MRYSPKPVQWQFHIAADDCYCTAIYGHHADIPDNNELAQINLLMLDGDEAVLSVCHKQELAQNVHVAHSAEELNDIILRQSTADNSPTPAKADKPTPKKTADNSTTPAKTGKAAPCEMVKTTSGYMANGEQADVNLYEGEAITAKCVDEDTGEVTPLRFRGLKSLHDSYRRLENKALWTLQANKTVFITLNFDKKYDFAGITTIGRCLQKWLKRCFSGTVGIMVYQPCADGSWHIHALLCHDTFCSLAQVSIFTSKLRQWANNYNSKQSDNVLDVQRLVSNKAIMCKWAYLDPYRYRERAIYYPVGAQVFKQIGTLKPAPKAIVITNAETKKWLKKIEARELPCFNQKKIFKDSDGFVIRTVDYGYFSISIAKLKAIAANSAAVQSPPPEYEQLTLLPKSCHMSSDEIFCKF